MRSFFYKTVAILNFDVNDMPTVPVSPIQTPSDKSARIFNTGTVPLAALTFPVAGL